MPSSERWFSPKHRAIVTTLVVGFVSGGPVGLGIAASGIVLSEGVNNLNDMRQEI
jgi:hypothetical protein